MANTTRTTKKDALRNMALYGVHVSEGNRKLGEVANFNLTPIVSCSRDAVSCNGCRKDCYACNSYRQYPNVRKSWNENTQLATQNVQLLYKVLLTYFSAYRGRYFRIHSAGDFLSVEYARMWYKLAIVFPEIQFLAYTKQFDIIREVPFYELENFSLRLSDGETWSAVVIPDDLKTHYKTASMVVKYETARDKHMFVCPGSCKDCKVCWHQTVNVAFPIHGQGKHAV